MAAASNRLEATAGRIAAYGATPASEPQQTPAGGAPVRIGYLPLPRGIPDATEDLTTMLEAEHSFKFNAVVFTTSADMLQSLYDAVD
jgi:hypothetical protein